MATAFMKPTIPGQSARRAAKGKIKVGDVFTVPGDYRKRHWFWRLLGAKRHLKVYTIVEINARYVKCEFDP